MSVRRLWWAPFALFPVLALPFLQHPTDGFEWWQLAAARQIVAHGVPSLTWAVDPQSALPPPPRTMSTLLLFHPPSTPYLSAAFLRFFGDAVWSARIPGVLVTLLTAAILFVAVRRWGAAPSDRRELLAVCAASLYLVHAATLQGALYLGFSEGTLLPLTWLLFVVVWLATLERPWLLRAVALGSGLALALWAKIATSLALPVALLVVAIAVDGVALGTVIGLTATAVGASLFLASWLAYSAHLSAVSGVSLSAIWPQPFVHVVHEARMRATAMETVVELTRVGLFLGPLLLLAATSRYVGAIVRTVRARRLEPTALVPVLVTAVILAYLVVPGGAGSFPKYYLVILPLLAWLAAEGVVDAWPAPQRWVAGVAAVGLVYYVVAVGDPLLVLNHDVRAAALNGDARAAIIRLVLAIVLTTAFPLAVALGTGRWQAALLVAALVSQSALIGRQAHGGYLVKHSYGTPIGDLGGVAEVIRALTPVGSSVLALPEFAYASHRALVPGMTQALWSDPAALARLLRESRPAAVVYGLPSHTLAQMSKVFPDPRVAAMLHERYRRIDVGEFVVWVRA
jgi:hypothetical protein